MGNAKSTLKKTTYSSLINSLQNLTNPSKTSTEIVYKIKSGKKNGLSLWLDQHSDKTSFGTIHDDFNGFKVFIGQSSEFPVLREKSLNLEPGRQHFVDLSGIRVSTDSSAAKLDVDYRGCYFNESVLEYHTTYSFGSCLFECKIKIAKKKLNCIPWYLPPSFEPDILPCDPWQREQFLDIVEHIDTETYCDECLPDCNSTKYSVTTTALPFRQCDSKNLNLSPLCDLKIPLSPKSGKKMS